VDLLSRDDLELLAQQSGPHSVSLYLPTHRSGPETQQGPIRLRNLLRRAEAELVDAGLRRPDVSNVLHPARELVEEAAFWRHQGEGVALFLRAGWFRRYRLPLSFEELAVVSDRFHVSPLLPLLTGDGHFLVLALSEKEARLLVGTRSAVHEVHVAGLPAGVKSALRYDDPQKEVGSHAGEKGGPGARVVVHGQGIGAEVQKERLGRYLRAVDDALHDPLVGEQAPLVLAGVKYVRAIYRDITTYPYLVEAGISGSPDRVSPEELRTRAWELVEPLFTRARDDAAAAYREARGTGRASASLEEVLTAAEARRVDVLFVATRTHVWMALNGSGGVALADQAQGSGSHDLLELAAVGTLLAGGTVYAVPEDDMPDRAPVAALFRY
jgi:Bacterial archaeo-eukaryotic release factor family 3